MLAREQFALSDQAQDAILMRDHDLNIFFWNKGAENLYGYSAREALGQPVSIILPADVATLYGFWMRAPDKPAAVVLFGPRNLF